MEGKKRDDDRDVESRMCNLSGLVTATEPAHEKPSILSPLKLIDPINIQ